MSDMQAAVTVALIDRFTSAARQIVSATRSIKAEFLGMNRTGAVGGASRAGALTREAIMARKLRLEYFKLHGAMGRIKSLTSGLFAGGLAGAGSILLAKGAMAATVLQQVMGPAIEMERFRTQLEQLEGSAEKGRRAVSWITDFAARTPLELPQVIEAYTRMRAMGLDPTNGSLQALTDTMAASGQGAEHLDRMVIALGQAWTKQKLQGEEAMQLLDAGVPVWDLLAKKTGKSAAELMKLASAGKLGRDAIQDLIEAMGARNAGASEKAARLWGGLLSNFGDAWYRFRLAIADSGPFQELKRNLQSIYETVRQMEKDGSLQALAEKIGASLTDAIQKAAAAGRGLWTALVVVAGGIDKIATAVGGYENLAYLAVGLMMAGKAMALIIAVGEAASILGTIVALGGVGAGGLVGLAAALVAAAGAAYYFREEIGKMAGVSGDTAFAAMYPMIAAYMALADVAKWAGETVASALTGIDWSGGARAAEQWVTSMLTGLRSGLQQILSWEASIGSQLSSALSAGLGSLYDVGLQWMNSLLDGIMAGVNSIVAAVSGIGGRIKGALGGLMPGGGKLSSPTGGGGAWPEDAAPAAPQGNKARALGGSVSKGGTYKVTEREPELLTPSRHMAITPLSKLAGLGGRNTSINLGGITVNGNADSGAINQLVSQLERRIRGALHDGAYAT